MTSLPFSESWFETGSDVFPHDITSFAETPESRGVIIDFYIDY